MDKQTELQRLLEHESLAFARAALPTQFIDALFNLANRDKKLARELCVRIAGIASADDELTTLLRAKLKDARDGKRKRGVKPGDPRARATYLGQLLVLYGSGLDAGLSEKEARSYVGVVLSVDGIVKTDQSIKNDLTEARKTISPEQLVGYLPKEVIARLSTRKK